MHEFTKAKNGSQEITEESKNDLKKLKQTLEMLKSRSEFFKT